MNKPIKIAVLLLLAAVACLPGPSADIGGEDAEARKARILANLELTFPRLAQMDVTIDEITSSDYPGLDAGSYTIVGPQGGSRNQKFFVSEDDERFYLIARGPIDVSRTAEEIAAELEERAAEATRAGEERRPRLEESVAGLPARGNPEAPVLIVEFSDFQCPFCARGAARVEEVLEAHGEDVRFVFKHFPLARHPWARPAAIASHCAARQSPDAFWALHDGYFESQSQITPANVLEKSREFLATSGIDLEAFAACAGDEESSEHQAAAAAVEADVELGKELGVSGTPGFFVNGRFLNGAQPLAEFEELIAQAQSAS